MLVLLIGTAILIVLIRSVVDEGASLLSAMFLTFATLVVMSAFVHVLLPLGGIIALILGGGLTAMGLGTAISTIYGAPLKTAFWVSSIFLVIVLGLRLGFQLIT